MQQGAQLFDGGTLSSGQDCLVCIVVRYQIRSCERTPATALHDALRKVSVTDDFNVEAIPGAHSPPTHICRSLSVGCAPGFLRSENREEPLAALAVLPPPLCSSYQPLCMGWTPLWLHTGVNVLVSSSL